MSHNEVMDIHQLNVSYLPAEDRLLLRVSTRQGAEFQSWLTRKVTIALWQALQGCAQNHAARSYEGKADVSDPLLRKELAEFASSRHLQAADFTQDYAPAGSSAATPNYSMQRQVNTPLLPTEVVLQAQPDGKTQMQLKETQRQISVMMDETLLHAIMALLGKAVAQAEWGIELQNIDTQSSKPVLN